jgi:hypothetical protein
VLINSVLSSIPINLVRLTLTQVSRLPGDSILVWPHEG